MKRTIPVKQMYAIEDGIIVLRHLNSSGVPMPTIREREALIDQFEFDTKDLFAVLHSHNQDKSYQK